MASAGADITSWLSLSLVPGLGDDSFHKLLLAFGAPENILAAGASAMRRVVPAPLAQAIGSGPPPGSLDKALAWLEQPGNGMVTLADADYPAALLNIATPPPLLYLKGRRELLNHAAFAIVGSRNATAQGSRNAQDFAEALSNAGFAIASGLALGIDAAAHRGGLAGESASVAVVGTGLDIVYPSKNRALAHALAEQGLLVSEFSLGTPALAANFPRRNRLISGLSKGCLVVEAALASGSLITARLAAEQGKEVFALPGSIHSPLAKGCHALIKQGAKLVECVQDILEELNWSERAAGAKPRAAQLAPQMEQWLDQFGFDPVDADTLCERFGLTAEKVSAILLQLELEGRIATLPGGLYQRVH